MSTPAFTNPYRGINAHLHSLAQNPIRSASIWTSFHASHIGHITDTLNAQLPANYIARSEQSLQIWTGDEPSRPRPDSAIFRTARTTTPVGSTPSSAAEPMTQVISIKALLEDDEEFILPSTVIYKVDAHEIDGTPVTRIELLSESNKQNGTGYLGYVGNRRAALRSGTSLIELDYLHQSASPLPDMPIYPNDTDAHAYSLALTDRRPDKNPNDEMLVYWIDVDMSLPKHVNVPLAGSDVLMVDFDAIYQHTFSVGRWGTNVDYSQPPRAFKTYSQADQQRIRMVMERTNAE